MKKHAVALRAFDHVAETFAKGAVLLDMKVGQFNDWSAEGVDLVREATDAEVAAARGEKRPPSKKAVRTRKAPARTKAATPKPAAIVPAAPIDPPVEAA